MSSTTANKIQTISRREAERHVACLTGNANTVMNFRTIPESEAAKAKYAALSNGERKRYRLNYRGTLSQVFDKLKARNERGFGIYYTLNVTDGAGAKRANIVAVRALPLDLDKVALPSSWDGGLQPQLVLESSPGKHQALFLVEPTDDLAAASHMAQRLAMNYGGDPSVTDAARVLRLAGFIHQKGKPFRSRLVAINNEFDPPYPLEAFDPVLPELPPRAESSSSGVGQLDAERAKLLLDALDPAKVVPDNMSWQTFAMALHASCGGSSDVAELFFDFCLRDSNYANDAADDNNRYRWNSFTAAKDGGLGIGTLKRICKEHRASDAIMFDVFSDAADDFDATDMPPADEMTFEGNDGPADTLVDLVERTMADKSAPFEPATLKALARAPSDRQEAIRRELKESGLDRLSKLDEAIKAAAPKKRKATLSQLLMKIATEQANISLQSDGSLFAQVVVNDVTMCFSITSSAFRDWLAYQGFKKIGRTASRAVIDEVVGSLKGKAREDDAPTYPTFVRVGHFDGAIYIDLANEKWQAIRIEPGKWSVIAPEDLPDGIRFKRTAAMLPLPTPVRGGKICELRDFINVAPDGVAPRLDDSSFVLLVMFMVSCFRAGPYGVLSIDGESGTAKTTTCELVRKAIDPAVALTKAFPRSDDDLFVGAVASHIQAFDNVSNIPHWTSDSLCRLTSGGGHSKRELYSNDGEIVLTARKPVVINGLHAEMQRGDLLDRSVIVSLAPITKRRTDEDIKTAYAEALPRILGALCDIMAHGLNKLPTVKQDDQTPRLADFETFGRACETAVWKEGTFRRVYAAMRSTAKDKLLLRSPVAVALTEFMRAREDDFEISWSGMASDLLDLIEPLHDYGKFDAKFPGSANSLSRRLREIAPLMREARNIDIRFERDSGKMRTREIIIKYI